MSGNTFGTIFKVTTCGESHGGAVATIIDGCPAGIAITTEEIQSDLDRRKPGTGDLTSPRAEKDKISILSGVFEGKTTGTPILLQATNHDAKSEDYIKIKDVLRPSHGDYTYFAKYGLRDWRGSGRASARETLARVAAGAIAKKLIQLKLGTVITAYVDQVGKICTALDPLTVTPAMVESSQVRCPDPEAAPLMEELIRQVKSVGDSVGGVITCVIKNVPAGLGEPVFDRTSAELAKAMLSINAVKGFEIGSGFKAATMRGSEHNDPISCTRSDPEQQLQFSTTTNNAGGVVSGITNGEPIYFRVCFKPVATINQPQTTVDLHGNPQTISPGGRHDPCVLPRAVPIVEAMSALVIADLYLRSLSNRAC